MGEKIRVAIIGTGGIAAAHLRAYQQFEDVQVVAGADIVPGKARAFFDRFGLHEVRDYEHVEALLDSEKVDAVSVCTYNRQHAAVTFPALERGVHVLCEKPLSFTLDEGVAMVRAARKANRILSVGFQPRYDYTRQYVDRILRSGELGQIYYVQSGGGRRHGIPAGSFVEAEKAGFGCLGDTGCYSIDDCLYALGYPRPLTVSAASYDHFGKNPKYWPDAEHFDVDDFAVAFIRLEGGITFVFKNAWDMHADTLGDTLWLGTEGALKRVSAPDGHEHASDVRLYKDVAGQQINAEVLPSIPFNAYGPPVSRDIFMLKVRDFCDAVIHGRGAPIPGEEILYNQAICDGIYRSAKLGREVEIVIPDID